MDSNNSTLAASRSLQSLVSEPDDDEQASSSETRAHIPETAATELEFVVGKSDSQFDSSPSTLTGVQAELRKRVSNHTFLQEPCNYPQPLLCSSTAMAHWTESQTPQESRKGESSRQSGAESLTEELVEIILARLPFPSILKSRILSKKWYHNLPVQSVGPLQTSSCSPTFCPVFLDNNTRALLCFDPTSSQWKPQVPLSYLPAEAYKFEENPFLDSCVHCHVTLAGPLLCIFHDCLEDKPRVVVSNVITKRWRLLPEHPLPDVNPNHIRLLQVGSNSYKVLLVYLQFGEIHIYNSGLRTWDVKRSDPSEGTLFCNSAYLDEKLYCLWRLPGERMEDVHGQGDSVLALSTYDLEHDVWLERVPLRYVWREFRDSAIFGCKDKLMVAIWFRNPLEPFRLPFGASLENKVGVFELDLITWQLKEVCRGPPRSVIREALHANNDFKNDIWNMKFYLMKFASDNSFIYISLTYSSKLRVTVTMAYNVQSQAWNSLPKQPGVAAASDFELLRASIMGRKWVGYAFQPGSVPFASV